MSAQRRLAPLVPCACGCGKEVHRWPSDARRHLPCASIRCREKLKREGVLKMGGRPRLFANGKRRCALCFEWTDDRQGYRYCLPCTRRYNAARMARGADGPPREKRLPDTPIVHFEDYEDVPLGAL